MTSASDSVKMLMFDTRRTMNLENFIVWKFSQKTNRCEKSQMGVKTNNFLKKTIILVKKNCKNANAFV